MKKRKARKPVGSENWIAGLDLKKDAFTRKARRHKMTVVEYANQVTRPGSKASAKTKKQAVLAKTFRKLRRKAK